jgi:hypothetical protein
MRKKEDYKKTAFRDNPEAAGNQLCIILSCGLGTIKYFIQNIRMMIACLPLKRGITRKPNMRDKERHVKKP